MPGHMLPTSKFSEFTDSDTESQTSTSEGEEKMSVQWKILEELQKSKCSIGCGGRQSATVSTKIKSSSQQDKHHNCFKDKYFFKIFWLCT